MSHTMHNRIKFSSKFFRPIRWIGKTLTKVGFEPKISWSVSDWQPLQNRVSCACGENFKLHLHNLPTYVTISLFLNHETFPFIKKMPWINVLFWGGGWLAVYLPMIWSCTVRDQSAIDTRVCLKDPHIDSNCHNRLTSPIQGYSEHLVF